MAILIEHLGGKWPFWISPFQSVVCPLSDKYSDYCEAVNSRLQMEGFESVVDLTNTTLNKKVRNHQGKFGFILVAGESEQKMGTVNVRDREGKQLGQFRVDKLIEYFHSLYPEKSQREKDMAQKVWTVSCTLELTLEG